MLDTVFGHRFAIAEKRLSICEECPQFNPNTTKCSECGCFMNFKSLQLSAECPMGKWGKDGPKTR